MRLRQFLWSAAGFALLVAVVVSVDSRVRDEINRVLWVATGMTTWDNRARAMTRVMTESSKLHSVDNGPMMVFAVVGGVLFLLMLRA